MYNQFLPQTILKHTTSLCSSLYNASQPTSIFTPHAQHERGKVIDVGVHIITYRYICGPESYFSDRFTFSNIRGRTSRRIYRLAVPLLSPEMLSSSSKSRIFLYNVHLALFVRMVDTQTHWQVSSLVNWN